METFVEQTERENAEAVPQCCSTNPHARFRLVTLVDETNLGGVWLAERRARKPFQVCCKLSLKSRITANVDDPILEIKALRKFRHPNIVRVLNSFDDGRCIWSVLEWCPRGCVYDFVTQDSLYRRELVKPIFHDIVKALGFLHARNVAHMDVKPENLLLTQDWRVKVCDFGFVVDIRQTRWASRGTRQYMAPEVYNGQSYQPTQADAWSLGLVLFNLCFRTHLWKRPAISSARFKLLFALGNAQAILEVRLRAFLRQWNYEATDELTHLLSSLLCAANERLTMTQVARHPWLSES